MFIQLRLSLQGLPVINNFLLQLLNRFGIAMCDKDAIKVSKVRSSALRIR